MHCEKKFSIKVKQLTWNVLLCAKKSNASIMEVCMYIHTYTCAHTCTHIHKLTSSDLYEPLSLCLESSFESPISHSLSFSFPLLSSRNRVVNGGALGHSHMHPNKQECVEHCLYINFLNSKCYLK